MGGKKGKTSASPTKPPDKGNDEANLEAVLNEKMEEIETMIQKRVEKTIKSMIIEIKNDMNDIKDEIKNKDTRIAKLEEEVSDLKAKTILQVLMKDRFEENEFPPLRAPTTPVATPAASAPPRAPTTSSSTFANIASAPQASLSVGGARSKTTLTRRPSTSATTRQSQEVSDQFYASRHKIIIKPVTLEQISSAYTTLTSDTSNFTPKELTQGEKFDEARVTAASDFLIYELNMCPDDFKLVKVEYLRDLSKQSMVVTLGDPDQTKKCLVQKARTRNDEVSVNQHWPHVSFNRRQALFRLMREAKKKNEGYNYQLRLGHDDLVVHAKEPGGLYRPVSLREFCVIEDLPLMGATHEKAPGRDRGLKGKRENSTPEHRDQAANKLAKIHSETERLRNEETARLADCETVVVTTTAENKENSETDEMETNSTTKTTHTEEDP